MLKTVLQKLFKRNSFLLNLLVSIVGLICVPLIAIQLFMILRSGNEFSRELTAHHQDTIKALSGAFEDQLQDLSLAAVNIQYNDDLMQPVKDDIAGYDLYKIAQDMTRYGSGIPLTDSIGIYYPNRNMCLHSYYKYSVQNICEQYFPAGSEGNLALGDFIQNSDSLALFYTGNYSEAISNKLLVSRSVGYNNSRSRKIIVFFVISDETLLDWCTVFMPFATGLAITDGEGRYIMKTAGFTDGLLTSDTYQAFLQDPDRITLTPQQQEDIIFYKYRDRISGRTFVVSMPRDAVQQSVTGYTRQTVTILICTVVLLLLLLAATLYINYRPVLRIVSKYIEEDVRDSKLSELEMIDSHFFALDQRINDQENLLATFTMSDLLSGIRVPREAAERYFAPEVYRSFVAATASIPLTAAQTNEVCRLLADRMPGKLIITTVPYRPETVLVYCSRETIRLTGLTAALQNILDSVTGKTSILHSGSVVSDVTQIQASYSESLPTEKLALVSGKDSPEEYPYAMLQIFVQQACAGEDTRALETLDILEAAVAKLKPSYRRFVTQKLLYSYLSGLQKGGIRVPEEEVDQMLAFPNSTLLFKLLRSSVASVKRREDAQCISGQAKLEEQLLTFVDERYLDSSLCLSAAADYLQTSIYSVSRIFKERTGMGLKEYITGKRLRQACRLLRTTTLPVTAIASQCGFENANYFTVVFRTEYGIPPSKYRAESTAARQETNEKEESE